MFLPREKYFNYRHVLNNEILDDIVTLLDIVYISYNNINYVFIGYSLEFLPREKIIEHLTRDYPR